MKKVSCIIFVVMIFISCMLAGCDKKDSEFVSKQNILGVDYSTDMQIMYLCGGGSISVPMTKSDTGYYYIGRGLNGTRIVIYIDRESRKATPLCSKPNCMHDDVEICDAYVKSSETVSIDTIFGATGNLIQYYKGSLYLLCGEYDESFINYNSYIMKMDLDGSNREKITDYFDYSVKYWCLHRGYLYYLTDSTLFRISEDSLESEPEVIYKAEYFIENGRNTFDYLYAYKNYIYFSVNEKDDKGNGEGMKSYCINLDTLEKSEIKIGAEYAIVQGFLDDRVIVTFADNSGRFFEIADLDGKNSKEFISQEQIGINSLTNDGSYFYLDNVVYAAQNEEAQIITVLDNQLNEIDTFKLPQLDLIVYNFFAPQDEDFFIFECFNENDEHVIVMADKSQIGSINGDVIEYTELCKLKWAKNNSNGIYYTE